MPKLRAIKPGQLNPSKYDVRLSEALKRYRTLRESMLALGAELKAEREGPSTPQKSS